MSNKTLSNAALELTQKIQMHFPRDIDPKIVQAWNSCSKDAITAACEVFSRVPPKPSILEFISTVKISATTEKFVAKDRFVENTSDSTPVKICYLEGNFKKWLLSKVEEPIGETILRCQKLRERLADSPIIGELGGEEKAETTLTEIFSLVEQQGSGQEGALLINGYANIFYTLVNGVLCAVSCSWQGDGLLGDGWTIYAISLDDQYKWGVGSYVFSRNPSVSQN